MRFETAGDAETDDPGRAGSDGVPDSLRLKSDLAAAGEYGHTRCCSDSGFCFQPRDYNQKRAPSIVAPPTIVPTFYVETECIRGTLTTIRVARANANLSDSIDPMVVVAHPAHNLDRRVSFFS
jgi:hypothetical protein